MDYINSGTCFCSELFCHRFYLYKIKSVHYKLKEEEKEFEPLEDYSYTAPMYIRNSYNFDTSTGEVLEFKDVVKDTALFFELADEIAANEYSELDIT